MHPLIIMRTPLQAIDGLELCLHFLDRVKSLNKSAALQNALVACATIRLNKMMPFFEDSGTHSPAEMQVFFVSLQGHQMQEMPVVMFAFQNKPWAYMLPALKYTLHACAVAWRCVVHWYKILRV